MKPRYSSLKAEYDLNEVYTTPQKLNNITLYSCGYEIEATRDNEREEYLFAIVRKDVKLNHVAPRKFMDRLMAEMGDTIYPVVLSVSANMEPISIVNHKAIVSRWEIKAKEFTDKHPETPVEHYINMSRGIVSDHALCLQNFLRESFVNFVFRDIYSEPEPDTYFESVWNHFPKRDMGRTILCAKSSEDGNIINVKGESLRLSPEMDGTLNVQYTLGDKGVIRDIECKLLSHIKDKPYTKDITIRAKKLKPDVPCSVKSYISQNN